MKIRYNLTKLLLKIKTNQVARLVRQFQVMKMMMRSRILHVQLTILIRSTNGNKFKTERASFMNSQISVRGLLR
jgi:hypothetical protein